MSKVWNEFSKLIQDCQINVHEIVVISIAFHFFNGSSVLVLSKWRAMGVIRHRGRWFGKVA